MFEIPERHQTMQHSSFNLMMSKLFAMNSHFPARTLSHRRCIAKTRVQEAKVKVAGEQLSMLSCAKTCSHNAAHDGTCAGSRCSRCQEVKLPEALTTPVVGLREMRAVHVDAISLFLPRLTQGSHQVAPSQLVFFYESVKSRSPGFLAQLDLACAVAQKCRNLDTKDRKIACHVKPTPHKSKQPRSLNQFPLVP